MTDDRLPKKLLYCELSEGKRAAGGPRKRYKDSLKASLGNLDLDVNSWEELATDRENWRAAVHCGAVFYEERQTEKAEEKRAQRKAREMSSVQPGSAFPCEICRRLFRARIGLYSHMRTHKT